MLYNEVTLQFKLCLFLYKRDERQHLIVLCKLDRFRIALGLLVLLLSFHMAMTPELCRNGLNVLHVTLPTCSEKHFLDNKRKIQKNNIKIFLHSI